MTNSEFIKYIHSTFTECEKLLIRKNADYSASEDPFRNFDASKILNISPEKAILVRMLDKIVRVSNLLEKKEEVTDEKIEDTLNDLINYSAILKVKLHE